ncbi:DUF3560 domain-containing protein [Chitinophaga sp. MM2321]|uniref:DUF3560 domain-containing protein n=1 Tax=Chitinophaga sp. MM2321 TaxID=3137178 RepID=UPI0032D5895A
MKQENYFHHNLESGKLDVFLTKSFYESLDQNQKKVFRTYCRWSRYQVCWISKGKAENCHFLKGELAAMGFVDAGTKGEKISFEEQVNKEKSRAARRAENAERKAGRAEQHSDDLYRKAKDMAAVIPFGQPIHIGHHSEKRDRNYRDKIHNTFGKSFAEAEKAEHYNSKAETARRAAEGAKYSSPRYLTNRIKESQKHIRICERRLSGKYNPGSPVVEISETSKEFYQKRIGEESEKLDYYKKRMKEINPEWSENLKASAKRNKGKSL